MPTPDRFQDDDDPWVNYFSAVVACVFSGIFLAVFLTTAAAVVWTIAGSAELVSKYGPFSGVARSYFKGCGISGLLIGLLSPLSRWRIGTVLLASMGSAALYLVVLIERFGSIRGWGLLDTALFVIMVAPLAAVVSVRAVRKFNPADRPKKPPGEVAE